MHCLKVTCIRCVLFILILVSLSAIAFLMLKDKINKFALFQFNNFKDFKIENLDKLLSSKEKMSMIGGIIEDSLKELLFSSFKNSSSKNQSDVGKTNSRQNLFLEIFNETTTLSLNTSQRNAQMKAFEVQMTKKEKESLYQMLNIFDKTMKDHNFTYFMYGGTLLGSYRHHDIIPWDDDMDLILSVTYHGSIESIFKPYEPDYIFMRAGGHDKFYKKTGKKAGDYDWLWPYLDISYYNENETHITDWIQTYGKWYSYPKEIVFPLHDRPLLNYSLPAPRDTFAFLKWTYNDDSTCKMYGYSHMVEGAGPHGQVNCRSLRDKFPFVEHLPHKDGVREVLKFKGLNLTDIVVPEPKYAVSKTFSISLKRGYEMPANITPPPEHNKK